MSNTSISSNNTTTTPLTNGSTFTGNKDLVDRFACAVIYFKLQYFI